VIFEILGLKRIAKSTKELMSVKLLILVVHPAGLEPATF
jgi:hypothetical protein